MAEETSARISFALLSARSEPEPEVSSPPQAARAEPATRVSRAEAARDRMGAPIPRAPLGQSAVRAFRQAARWARARAFARARARARDFDEAVVAVAASEDVVDVPVLVVSVVVCPG